MNVGPDLTYNGNEDAFIAQISPLTYFVDDDNITGPWDGSSDHPFQYIQDGIDAASISDRVFVRPGTYMEIIDYNGKEVRVESTNGATTTVIDGGQAGSVVTFQNNEGAGAVLDGFTITNGSAAYGGGLYLSGTATRPLIQNNMICDNQVSHDGGGLYCDRANPEITGNLVKDNHANSGSGGGIYCYYMSSSMANNIIFNNMAGSSGGGITAEKGNPQIIHCTITGNSLFFPYTGGGIHSEDSSPNVKNSILWDNGQKETSGTMSITGSVVKNGHPGEGNIDLDPLFVNPASGDFHLTVYSPCVNRGLDGVGVYNDRDGDSRPYMGTPDMGADEYTGTHLLEADTFTVSETGGVVNFSLHAGSGQALRSYFVLGSRSGTVPGVLFPKGAVLPLNWDLFTDLVLLMANSAAMVDFHFFLNSQGMGTAQFNTLGPLPPGFVGTTLHFAYLLYSPINFVSNPIAVHIVP